MTKAPGSSSARVSLRDLFRQEQQANDGNPAAAFIAILDETDRRMAGLSGTIDTNSEAFRDLAAWHKQVTGLLQQLPGEMEGSTRTALQRLQPALTEAVEAKARMGAQEGTRAAKAATEALREARQTYEARKKRLTRMVTYGLPAAFGIAIAFGFMFGSWMIPALPASWEWPCRIIGSQHYVNQTDGATFCLIHKK